MSASNTEAVVPEVRILVVGDPGTGKSSLIHAAAYAESWDGAIPPKVPSRMPPTRLPEDIFQDRVSVTAIDVGALDEHGNLEVDQFRHVNTAIVLVYSKSTFDRLRTVWLPLLKRYDAFLPVILAGSRSESERGSIYDDYKNEKWISRLRREFPQVHVCCFEFPLGDRYQIPAIFRVAQKAILYPCGPLFDPETQMLRCRCVWALMRIFILCDNDRDGGLCDGELNDLVVKCFDEPRFACIVEAFATCCFEVSIEKGLNIALTLRGFLMVNELFVAKGSTELTWTILRKFGYNNLLRLSDDQLLLPIRRAPDQLTSAAVEFLRGVFFYSERDYVCSLIFSRLRHEDTSYRSEHAVKSNEFGGLSLDGFLAQWALITLLDPVSSVDNLIHLGYPDHPSSAVRVTRGRWVDRKKQQSDRNVFQCFVFGPKAAGKSSLLQSFVGRPFSESYTPTFWEECITVNMVDHPDGTQKTLILREIPYNMLLYQEVPLADCDIAVFVHDISDESSWLGAAKLLVQVAGDMELTGYEVPCLIVAAKGDLAPYPTAIQDSTRASQDMGIESPIRISTKLGDFNNVFRKIVRAAEHPHLNIPKITASKCRKQYHGGLTLPLMVVSVVVAVIGLVAHRVPAI